MRTYFVKIPKWVRLVYPKALWSTSDITSRRSEMLLTIDDGPHPESTPLWLETLYEAKIKAVFFLIGEKCERFPHLVNDIISAGHQIGSHGYAHIDGWRSSTDCYIADLQRSLEIIDTNLFRPAFGRMTPLQFRETQPLVDTMMWSLMPGDFDEKVDALKLEKRLMSATPDDIIVLHDHPNCIEKARDSVLALSN